MSKLTPMLKQYLEIKQEYKDCILFFRLGDFYEMFFEDAVTASRELEIVLTGRDSGNDRIPMCGIPYHSATGYLARLLQKGYKVAICEQVEDPKNAKGIVDRAVVRVITPGTVIEDQLLKEKRNNYLMTLTNREQTWGIAYVDLSTGEFQATQLPRVQDRTQMNSMLTMEFNRIRPAEVYLSESDHRNLTVILALHECPVTIGPASDFDPERAYQRLTEHFQIQNLQSFGLEAAPAAIASAGAILQYLFSTQKNTLSHLRRITTYELGAYLALDPATRRNLELVRTMRGGDTEGSLLGVLDQTVTSMGARLLHAWVEQPLARLELINARQSAVAELVRTAAVREDLRAALDKTYDMQRLLGKLAGNTANARDLLALKNTIREVPAIKDSLKDQTATRLIELSNMLLVLPDLTTLLEDSLREDLPASVKDGGMIKTGFNPELDTLLAACNRGKQWVAELEQKERERSGIRSLKVGFNQVFGYYIEVTNANLNLVPPDYIRKQTLANGERFINQTLKEYEDLILNAHEKSIALEYEIFCNLRSAVLYEIDKLQSIAAALAELDVFAALAETAVRYHYIQPVFNDSGRILILEGRHPVVERSLTGFVPNDTLLDQGENRTLVITGPNMAGKSTYMRQVALIVLMAHIGSFVPAKTAELSLVDRIFTRVGASDDLATGQSTFMVEMNEVAYILNHATIRSLVVLDEIGRGTSTFDGLSIAWSVIEYINNCYRIGCKTLVATHYHELTELESRLGGIKNYHIAVQRDGENINFLRKIMTGHAEQSYGIEVARLAGLPAEVIGRAREILKTLEKNESAEFEVLAPAVSPQAAHPSETEQLLLFPLEKDLVLEELVVLDLASTTPLQALNLVYQWQKRIRSTATSSGK